MMELLIESMNHQALAMISMDRAVTAVTQIVGGVLTIVFLFVLINLGIGRSVTKIIMNVLLFAFLMALTIRPQLLFNIGSWLIDLVVR